MSVSTTTQPANPQHVTCPFCDASPGFRCKRPGGPELRAGMWHSDRVAAFRTRTESDEEMSRS